MPRALAAATGGMAYALADHMPLVLCSGGEHVKVNRLAPGISAMARSKPRLSISAAMKATLRERRPGGRADRILPLLSPLSEPLLSLLPAPNRLDCWRRVECDHRYDSRKNRIPIHQPCSFGVRKRPDKLCGCRDANADQRFLRRHWVQASMTTGR